MDEKSPDPRTSNLANQRAEHDRRIVEKLRRELGPQVCELLEDSKVIEIMLNPDGSLWCEWLGAPNGANRDDGQVAGRVADGHRGVVAAYQHHGGKPDS